MKETIEVNARDYAELQRFARSGKVAEQVWNDPEHGMKLKALVKEAIPEANIPELDALNQTIKIRDEAFAKVSDIEAKFVKFEEENKKRLEDQKVEREEASFAKKIEEVRKAKNFTEEGMKKVFDRMKAHNNPDIEAAAAWVISQEPKFPTQPAYAPQNMDLYGSNSGDKEWAELNRNPMGYADKIITEILNDPQYN